MAYNMGIDRMHDFMAPFGFGSKTGVDNTNERSGLLPSKKWKRIYKRSTWYHGETLSVGIGQGYLLATPMQLAASMVPLANRGKHFAPRFLKQQGDQELLAPELPVIDVEDEHWDAITHAMEEVVHGRKGTANRINRGLKYRIAGKTGSAQIVGIGQDEVYDEEQVAKRKKDHGLFVAFAPVENPKIVVAIIVENGVHGSWVSPIARKVFDAYLLDQGMLEDDSTSGLIAEVSAEGTTE